MRARTLLAITPSLLLLAAPWAHGADWPTWRADIAGSGKSVEPDAPVEWGPDKNILWRTPLPNRGNSTPVVSGDRVFVTQAIEAENFRCLMCFDRADGRLLWKSGVTYAAPERTHKTNPYCSASPATDGERTVASFASAGVYAYDLKGKELWHRDLGPIDHIWGHASSPVIYRDLAIVYHGPGPGSRLMALEKRTGKTVWEWQEPTWDTRDRTDGFKGRDDGVEGTWSTPIIIAASGRDELVMAFPTRVMAFDPSTGERLWSCGGMSPLIYTSPFYGDDTIVTLGGYYGNSLAVRPGGSGDVTGSHRLWHFVRHNGGIGSGIIQNGHAYYHTSGGDALCLDLKTGATVWEQRLRTDARQGGGSWASMTLAGDRIYLPNKKGDTFVFRAAPKYEQIGVNSLGEETDSSVVISGGRIFIRTHKALWCVGK